MGVGPVEEEDKVGGPQNDWITLYTVGLMPEGKLKRRLLMCVWNGSRALAHCIHSQSAPAFALCISQIGVHFFYRNKLSFSVVFKAVFLNLGTVDILDQRILCLGGW